MTDIAPEVWNAISAVLIEKATAEDKKVVEHWLKDNEENRRFFLHLKQMGNDRSYDHALQMKDVVFNTIQKRIYKASYRRPVYIWQYIAAASIALLLLVSGLYYFRADSYKTSGNIVANSPYGIKSKIILSDGTMVNLNAGSSLSYPGKFKGHDRTVMLKGEAYFEVTKESDHPFIVITDAIQVKVLGTHFNLRAYPDDDNIITSLLEGSVSVTKSGNNGCDFEGIILKPGQQALFSRRYDTLKVQFAQTELYAAWKDGRYFFEGERLGDIVRRLERGFNAKINIQSDKLKEERFSGVFDKGESLFQILDIMKQHQSFDYKVCDEVIEIFEIKNERT